MQSNAVEERLDLVDVLGMVGLWSVIDGVVESTGVHKGLGLGGLIIMLDVIAFGSTKDSSNLSALMIVQLSDLIEVVLEELV